MTFKCPDGLSEPGLAMWRSITTDHPYLGAEQVTILEAACLQRDRADQLAAAASAGDVAALRHEREALLAMARLVTALRLPDPRTGKRPQLRAIRGVHTPTVKERMSALDRARHRAGNEGA